MERGQGLYGFIHRTFQEYYVMRYLVDTQHYPLIDKQLPPGEDLKAFVQQKCHISTWHEPLLLLIAYKSEQRDRDERRQATTLIQAMLDTRESYDTFLQRHLPLAASLDRLQLLVYRFCAATGGCEPALRYLRRLLWRRPLH